MVAKRPDYYVVAKKDSLEEESPLVRVGAAWINEARTGLTYIRVVIDCLPIGKWDGSLQLHPYLNDD